MFISDYNIAHENYVSYGTKSQTNIFRKKGEKEQFRFTLVSDGAINRTDSVVSE